MIQLCVRHAPWLIHCFFLANWSGTGNCTDLTPKISASASALYAFWAERRLMLSRWMIVQKLDVHALLKKSRGKKFVSELQLQIQVWSPNVRCVRTPSSPPSPLITPHHHRRPLSPLVTTNSIPSISAVKNRCFRGFEKKTHYRRTDGRTLL